MFSTTRCAVENKQFLCINTIMTNSDKHNNLFAHAQLQNSVNKAFKHKKEHNSETKRDKLVEF